MDSNCGTIRYRNSTAGSDVAKDEHPRPAGAKWHSYTNWANQISTSVTELFVLGCDVLLR
jgi:hypothetical protein